MKNGNLIKSLDSLLLGVGTALMVGIMVSQEFRHTVGVVMDAVLGWLPEILPFHMVLFALAAITGLYASLIQKYTMDWDYLKKQQETMRSFQREMREAQLSGDKARQQQLQVQQREMLGDQSKMMKMQLKPMAYIGIVSIPLFMWAYLYIDQNSSSLVLNFPFWGVHNLSETVIGPIFYWFYWYFICSIPVSQIIRKALDIGGTG
ncbi:MAG TPA: EMC3/TMCO1 family protein [Methanothrix sp.]|nr:EMC3/TMCO1 family protein [Methanothrix sp.]HPR66037.1 EMC3/TMCO1 family protein [Methanothrix sp.]